VHAGYQVRTGLWRAADPCHGIFAGYEVVMRGFSLIGRVAACRGGYQNATLTSTADEVGLQIEGAHVWDLRFVSVQVGLALGPSVLLQRFDTTGVAPSREALAGALAMNAGAELPLRGRFALTLGFGANVYAFKQRDLGTTAEWATPVTFMTRVGLAARW
jgi:hypothetical protein